MSLEPTVPRLLVGPGSLSGRVVVVTGASSGVGRSVALGAAHAGARAVVVADLSPEPREGGDPTADLVARTGAVGRFLRCDVSDPEQVRGLHRTVDDDLGGADVLVNNAGVFAGGPVPTFADADFDRLFDVNVRGVFLTCRAFMPAMVAAGGGSIVNVASLAAVRGSRHSAVYAATKGAVRAFSAALASDLGGTGVRVNCVLPGFVDTAMTRNDVAATRGEPGPVRSIPLGRPATPEDVANAVVFAAGDQGAYLHGASLVVDGGLDGVL